MDNATKAANLLIERNSLQGKAAIIGLKLAVGAASDLELAELRKEHRVLRTQITRKFNQAVELLKNG